MTSYTHIEHSTVSGLQIGTRNSNMVIVNSPEPEWQEVEEIWRGALENLSINTKPYDITQKALEYTQTRNKEGLRRLVKDFLPEFMTNILSGVAAEVVMRFLL